jgi:hypothetical protein
LCRLLLAVNSGGTSQRCCWHCSTPAHGSAARTLLVLGRAPRRANKRAEARQCLEQARAGFEQLGCPGWAAAAAAELDRVSGRRAAPAGALTPGGQRVAELAAGGLSNKEIAGQLYLSVYAPAAPGFGQHQAQRDVTARPARTARPGPGPAPGEQPRTGRA